MEQAAWLAALLVLGVAIAVVARRWIAGAGVRLVTPAELLNRVGQPPPPVVVDLRDWRDVLKAGDKLPGALVMPAADVLRQVKAGALAGEIILYCG